MGKGEIAHFSFSHNVFKRLVLQTRKNQGLFGKELTTNLFQKPIPPSIQVCLVGDNQWSYFNPDPVEIIPITVTRTGFSLVKMTIDGFSLKNY